LSSSRANCSSHTLQRETAIHRWIVPLRDAVARAGGFRLADGFISPLDLAEIGLASRDEAEQMNKLAWRAQATHGRDLPRLRFERRLGGMRCWDPSDELQGARAGASRAAASEIGCRASRARVARLPATTRPA